MNAVPPPPRVKILAVDDVPSNLIVVEGVLADLGVQVVTAGSGRDALRLSLEHDFALILLDVHMPDMDGFETAKLIRERERSKQTPIIFVTASVEKHYGERRGYELGAIDYLFKPVDPIILQAKVSGFIELANARARLAEYARQQEQRAQHSEEKFRSIVETSKEWIWEWDTKRDTPPRIAFSNRAIQSILGYLPEEVVGQVPFDLMQDEDSARARAIFVEQASRPAGWQNIELRWKNKNGGIRWLASNAIPLFDGGGHWIGFRGSDRDVTEKRELEAKFLRAQRLESIGTLAGGIAHDLNNVLAPILMSVQLLRMRYTSEADKKILDSLESSAERGAGMVRQILSFARGTEGKFTVLNLRHLVKEVIRMLKETLPRTIRITSKAPNDLWPVNGDATQLNQVLMNLCVNARDAMPNGGQLELAVANFTADAQFAGQNPDAKPGPYVLLTVSDTGSGIPQEIIDKIFDPFFTTKEVGKGTGLGLATVQGITRSHGGFLTLHSHVGQGTRFSIFLPADPSAVHEAPPDQPAPLPTGRGELILVVDDESGVRGITQTTLEAHGYRAVTARDGIEALTVFVQHQAEIQAVLTDITMPHMDGVALVRALRRIQPASRIMMMSGLMDRAKIDEAASLGSINVLQKPFNAEKLLTALRETLNGAGAG